jgi:hypothetical protein
MSIEFHCSQCGRLLRTGDDTVGLMAQCPQCGGQTQVPAPESTEFSASPSSGGGGTSDTHGPEPDESAGTGGPYQAAVQHYPGQGYSPNSLYALNRVSAPAVCLMVTAVLGLVAGTLGVFDTTFKIGMMQAFPRKDLLPAMFMGPIAVTHFTIGIVMSIVVLVGAAKMKGLESYRFAIVASILSLIPCTSPCCCLGLPFGIWALVVLSDPMVKASFKS